MKKIIDGITVITNNQERLFLSWHEIPKKIRQKEFDWITEEKINNAEMSDMFIKYKGTYYNIDEFTAFKTFSENCPFKDWAGYISDSAFSGILIKLPKYKTETYIIGRYYQ